MEIIPILGIRGVPAVKPPKNEPQLSAVFHIENTIGPQQDTFSKNEGKMAGGQDDESADEEAAAEPSADSAVSDRGLSVNVLA